MSAQPIVIDLPEQLRSVTIDVPGDPVPKGRPRFSRKAGRVRVHTDAKTESYEGRVKWLARGVMRGAAPYEGPVLLVIAISLPIPASWSLKRQSAAAAGQIAATKKPDADNVVKALKDGMNGVVYVDDGQVVDLIVSKRYAREPGVRIKAIELNLQRA